MTIENARTAPEGHSRRSLLALLASSPLILASCKSLATTDNSSAGVADKQIKRVLDGHDALVRSHPTLPGIRSLAQFNEQLAEGFSPADLSTLAAAFSLKASEQVARIRRPITKTDVRSALSRPIDMAPYGRSFLERTLAEARAREATDPAYRQELQLHRRRCHCLRDTPCWICGGMAVIIVIAIIVLL
jgi:hypothetical protein